MNSNRAAAGLFFCCFVAVAQGQLTLQALPDVLFVDNGGVHGVELGTVVRARCTASSSSSAPLLTWFKDGGILASDPPHIRIRSTSSGSEVSSVLTVDNFDSGDNGDYYCEASNDTDTLTSTTLSLSVVDDDSIRLFRNPVEYETVGLSATLKMYDTVHDNRSSFTIGVDFEPSQFVDGCCQVLRCIAAIPGDQTQATNISQLTVKWLRNEEELVHSAGQTEITNDLRYQSAPDETRYVSQLRLLPFQTSDIGVYQCVYSDFDSDRELVYSTPFSLDTDNSSEVMLEAVSPVDIILDPPEKLVIEVESSGGYYRHAWYKNDEQLYPNDDTTFREANPARFSEFFQVFVQDPTNTSDHGIYRVDLVDSNALNTIISVYQTLEFSVTPPVTLSVEALNTTTVTVLEGEDVNISCIAKANPLPSNITWSFGGSSTSFTQTDSVETMAANVPSAGTFSFTEGNTTSTLHISAALYPTHSGTYTCSSTTDTTNITDTIVVEVQVPPEVTVSAASPRVSVGQSLNITCSIARTSPSDYTIEWTLSNTTGGATTLTETGETLTLTDITDTDFGTYTCTVTNSADLSGSANITIEEGFGPSVSIADIEAAVAGDDVTLNCTATGDTPLVYQWTTEGSTTVINSDNTTGELILTNIMESDFGTYVCEVSNALQTNTASINLEQATISTTSTEENVTAVEGETLELSAAFQFNLILDSISWKRDGTLLQSGSDGVTITDSDLDPPNATSTLRQTDIRRSSDTIFSYVANATSRAGSSTVTFNVDVLHPPEVSVSATRTRVPVNGSTSLTCSVASSNPPELFLVWTLTNTTGITTTLNTTDQTLELSGLGLDQFGTYTCNVTNSEGLSGEANIILEEGELPEVIIDVVDPAVAGDDVTLNCTATGDTPLVYQWTTEGSTTVINSDNTTGTLELADIQENQFGTYVCTVTNDLGMATNEVILEQAVAPTAGNNATLTFSVGDDLVLMAVFSDFNLELDSIVWTQNSSISLVDGVTISHTALSPPSASSTLTRLGITGVSYGGTYTATASNRAGSSSTTFTVEITAAPEIILEETEQQNLFNESTEASLTCTASGIPPVAVNWLFAGDRVNENETASTIELRDDLFVTTSVLTIMSVERSDAGTYTCIANNGVPPSASALVNLTLNFAPVIEQDPIGEDVLAPDEVFLMCTAEGEPSPDIVWVKEETNGAMTEFSESGNGLIIDTVKSTSMSFSTLTINSADSFDTANYSCMAENLLGSTTSQPAEVTVFVSPSIQSEQDIYVAIEFQLQEVTCSATGVPPPTITFMRRDVVLDGNSNSSDINDRVNLQDPTQPVLNGDRLYVVNRTLQIVSPTGDDTGIFTCLASFEVLNQTLTASDFFNFVVQVVPTIEFAPADIEVISPRTAMFYCEIIGVFLSNITWQMNGNVLESGGDIDIEIDARGDLINSTLTIQNTVPSDAGNYTCLAENDAGRASASAQLTVNFPPAIMDPLLDSKVTVNEGMTAVFACAATGVPAPTLTWRRSGFSNFSVDLRVSLGVPTFPEPLSTSNGTVYFVSRQLNLSNTRDSDSGTYYCEASSGEEESLNMEVSFELVIRVAPVITAAPVDMADLQGRTVVLSCNVTGRPRPDITWWREDGSSGNLTQVTDVTGKTLIYSEVIGGERGRTSILAVMDIQPSDAGVYVCRADNDAGQAEALATLTVLVVPEIDFPPEDYEYTTIQFMDTVFECNATGIPAPTIQFFLDGSLLESNETFSILDPVNEVIDVSGEGDLVHLVTRRLLISPTLDGDSNNYTCVATNDNGTDSVEFELVVFVAPVIVGRPDSQIVLKDDRVVLSCVSEGRPPPAITWLKQLVQVEESDRVSINIVLRGARQVASNLTIEPVQPRDSVQYTCMASNVAGNDAQSADLTVHVFSEVQFLVPSPLLTVNQSDSATFTCNATGVPAPVINWFIGDQRLSDVLLSRVNITETEASEYATPNGDVFAVTSVLTIELTMANDSGTYTCNASNAVGASMMPASDEESTELYVQVPPVVVAIVEAVIGNENESSTLQFRIDNAEPVVELGGLRWFYSAEISSSATMEDITNSTNRTIGSQLITSFSSDGRFFNLTIVNIQQQRQEGEETDQGRYFLQATNPAGTSSAYVDLEVYGPPLIIVPPEDEFVIAGGSAVFSCTALAFPAHITEWTFVDSNGDATIIISTYDEENNSKYAVDNSTSSPSFGQLVVLNTRYSDRGEYMCTAINEVDSRSALAYLTVHVPPVIVSTSPETRANIVEQVVLVCSATGFPHPTITWSKDGELLPEDSNRVRTYVFEASAPVGSASGSAISLIGSGLVGSGSAGSGSAGSGSAGSGSIADLIRDAVFSEDDIQRLGELGVVSVVAFQTLVREDTGDYSCTATNSLPGGQTGTEMADSPLIPLTVLEVPDVVNNFTSGLVGARWAVLEWTFGFDGNSDIISLRVRVTQEDETNMIENDQDVNSYNVTEGILPFTSYDFQVSVCNAIGCGAFTDIVTVTTDEDAPDAAPTITTSVSPSSTSLLVSWDPPVADKQNGILRDYIVYYTSDAELPMSMWERTSTPDNSITLTGLRIFTLYTVSVAASTMAGVGPYDTVEFRTLNDTCSEPFAVMSTDIGETTISLTWSESATPNGIVDSYLVSYGIEGTDDGATVTSEREAVQLVNLKPFTEYTVTVTCVNGAGSGNSSSPLTRTTNSAPPTLPDDAISQVSQQPGGRQFSVLFNKPDETNGPISHYHAVAVLVAQDSASDVSLGDPDADFNSFDSIDNVYSPACEKVSQTTAYIAAEFGSDEFQGSTLEFTFGKEDTVNDKERYANGPLCYSTSYAFFLRVYNDVSDNNVRRSVRQTASDRQYNRFSSSGYVTYNTESAPSGGSSSSNSGAIAGTVVVVIILLFAAVIVAIVIVFVIKKKRVTIYKTHTEAVDFDTSFYQNEHVELTDYRSPEEGGGHKPIGVGQLAVHVEQLHLNENCMFGEEYKVLQEMSPKHPVEACIHSDNKQRNRYANIQCFDHSRCILKPVEGHEHDYINANFIDGYSRRQEYITTQGPLPNTVEDFWRLVWDYNVFSIIMLTNLTEKMKVKCSQYWPRADSQTYAGITVTFKTITNNADFVVRTFDVKRVDSEEVRQIHQFHYISWPDFGVPRHATPVLHFLRRIRDTHHYNNSQPMLIHCSAGVGRTGSLIAIDVELQRAQKEGMVDTFNYVLKMRDQRNLMIQTEAQYIFLYDAILEGTTSRGTEIPVEGLSSRMKELELMDREGETGYRVEFNRLRQFRVNIKEFTDANDNANQFKNRLANALPYNDNRVYLTTLLGVCGSDYINASFIDGYTRKGTFIATQGPLPQTINDFWRMVAEKDVHVIVMLTQLEEKGKEMCACYWPMEVSGTETRGSLSTELLSEEPFQDFTHRKIKLDQTVKGALMSRVVHHFQFTAWPENGAPEEGAGMIDLIGQVIRVQQQTGDKPIIVHCSAGIGRTGAFCALSIAIERVKAEGLIDVFHTVKHLRTQRPHMVQTPEQYIFCYRAISEYVSSLDQYSNFV